MDALKGSRTGLAVAVAGLGIGIAIIVDSVLAEKRHADKRKELANRPLSLYTPLPPAGSKQKDAPAGSTPTEENEVGSDDQEEDESDTPESSEESETKHDDDDDLDSKDDCPNCSPEAVGRTLLKLQNERPKQEIDETRMLPGETYVEWYDRQRMNTEKKRAAYYNIDMAYKGDGSDASKRIYLMKQAYVSARLRQEGATAAVNPSENPVESVD